MVANSIYYMPRRPKYPKPPHGKALVARRAEVGKSLDDIVGEGQNLYKQLLYRLENGKVEPSRLTYPQLTDLSNSLEWSMEELASVLGLSTARKDGVIENLGMPVLPVQLPVVNAGAGLPQWNDEAETITLVVPETKGRDRGDLFCVRVCGDSMVGYANDGDLVVFERASTADRGKIVAVHIPDDGLVVKRYYGMSEDGSLILGNENRSVQPLTFEAPEGSTIYGVSIGRWQPD